MKVLAFGEILFDCYPTDRKIGGAPLNFSAHLSQLGADVFLYSGVGEDALGNEAIAIAKTMGVDTRFISRISQIPTGVCKVTYQGEEPAYDLSQFSSYDNIKLIPEVLSESFDLFYFGTLASREEPSRNTLETILKKGTFKQVFFDTNLRQHYYSEELVTKGLLQSDIIKMNREEFQYVKEISQIQETDTQTALQKICQQYAVRTAILTLDKDGSAVWDKEQGFFTAPAKESKFVSAVGAGDSFCACFLFHRLQGASIPDALEKASSLSAFVVSCEEAVPSYPNWLKETLQ